MLKVISFLLLVGVVGGDAAYPPTATHLPERSYLDPGGLGDGSGPGRPGSLGSW